MILQNFLNLRGCNFRCLYSVQIMICAIAVTIRMAFLDLIDLMVVGNKDSRPTISVYTSHEAITLLSGYHQYAAN